MANPVNRKEAILAGENVAPVTREEYFVKEAVSNGGGGGGNLEIIPEQTVTFAEDDPVTIQLAVSGDFTYKPVLMKVETTTGLPRKFYGVGLAAYSAEEGGNIEIPIGTGGSLFTAEYVDGNWKATYQSSPGVYISDTYKISAVYVSDL